MTGKTLQSQREDSPLLASQANGASYKTSSTSEASAKTSDAAFSRWRNDNDGSAGRKHAKRQMLCLQFSQILFMILDLASLVVITWWCLGSRVFWCMHWLAGRASLAWPADPSDLDFQVRFWGLPVVATLVKMVLLVLVMHRPQSKVLSVLFHALCLGFLVLLAVDSFELDALTQVEEEKHLLVGANVANSLPIIFTVLEVVNLNYLATSTSEKKPEDNLDKPAEEQPKGISFVKMVYILKPYFWPHGVANKVRASSTYIILIISKVTNLLAPLYMAEATNALLAKNVSAAIWNISAYALLTLTSKIFKELQSLIYLKVKQHAYIELATMTYEHVHKLSYDWHVRKKLGDVLRSMDRGVESANSMVSYVFLYLLPTLGESIVVVVIFAAHFQLASISFVAFLSLVVYAFLTIKITLWRKKFRQASTKHDNEYHDKATDALINYETIKYFSNERYEVDTYTKIIEKYQQYSISVQASLSLLNGSQSFIIQVTVLLTLALAAPHVVNDTGRQIDVGAFVAISVYLNNLFQPLFFLGSIYNMVINAVVDMQKLSELLSVEPDIVDSENAKELNICDYGMKNGIEVGFRDVHDHGTGWGNGRWQNYDI
ncbi:TPA: hypothetical protein N0F65_006945 [Lagenidium giganteum]|uniref:ABC transmembrane type-1 domain-containing protein n=1 Tax=Lagenidium giganteum TaxID=4803 RepID=A0AAV2ZD51_9STRA|nr:TPA: hypothetical protein N0F65_006945 [Lagenidium giganteum]